MNGMDKFMKEIDSLYEKYGREADKHIQKLLDEKCHVVQIHCPHLDDNMQPHPELCNPTDCPAGKDGDCGSCDRFVCYKTETGEVFAYMAFSGYCLKE